MRDKNNIAKFPCVRNCCLNDNDICLGCFRSLDEITRWGNADSEQRLVILTNAKRRQEANQMKLGS